MPNAAGQQSYMAYEDYQMLTATPGQNITLTWPRTATPDGTVADGSETVWVYFYNDSSINEGRCSLPLSTCCRGSCQVQQRKYQEPARKWDRPEG